MRFFKIYEKLTSGFFFDFVHKVKEQKALKLTRGFFFFFDFVHKVKEQKALKLTVIFLGKQLVFRFLDQKGQKWTQNEVC